MDRETLNKLAIKAENARLRFVQLSMMNAKSDPLDAALARSDYLQAQNEYGQANAELEAAIKNYRGPYGQTS